MRKAITIGLAFFLFLTSNAKSLSAEDFKYGEDYSKVSYFSWQYSNPLDKNSGTENSILSPMKDQGSYGTCWSFATMGSAESQLRLQYAKQGLEMPGVDFSERYTAYTAFAHPLNEPDAKYDFYIFEDCKDDPNLIYNQGGNLHTAISSIDQLGFVDETECPYSTTGMECVNNTIKPIYKAKEYYIIPNALSVYNSQYLGKPEIIDPYDLSLSNNKELLKEMITRCGPGYTCMCALDPYFDKSYDYVGENLFTNHAIMLIGWDDNIEAEKFECIHAKRTDGRTVYIETLRNLFNLIGYKLILDENGLPISKKKEGSIYFSFLCEAQDGQQRYFEYWYELVEENDKIIWNKNSLPEHNGAWICKNSWGETPSTENGYFYVSYDDIPSCEYLLPIVESDNGKYPVYQTHANFYPSLYCLDENNESQIEFGSKYSTDSSSFLKAVTAYVNENDMGFELKIFKGTDVNGDLVYSQSGRFGENGLDCYAGKRTIDLNKYVFLDKGQNYFVTIKLTGKYAFVPIVVEDEYSTYKSKTGLSYIFYNNEWVDSSEIFKEDVPTAAVVMGTFLKETQGPNGGDFTVTSLDDNSSGESIINLGKADELYGLDAMYPDKKTLSNMTIFTEANVTDTYAGTITGEGKVIKEGAGTQILSGACDWTGGLDVNNGILSLKTDSLACGANISQNGTLETSQPKDKPLVIYGAVDNSGIFMGNVSLSGSLKNSNTLLPGNCLNEENSMTAETGTILVAENFEQTKDGKTFLDITSDESDQIFVKTKATLAGTYNMELSGKLLPAGEYLLKLSDYIFAENYEYDSAIVINGKGYENEFMTVEAVEQSGLDSFKFKTTYKDSFMDKVRELGKKYAQTRRGVDFYNKSVSSVPINDDAGNIYLKLQESILGLDSMASGNIRASVTPTSPLADKVMDASNPGFVNSAMSASVARARILTDTITERIINRPDTSSSKEGTAYAVPMKYQAKQKENSNTAAWRDNTNGMFAGVEKQFGKWTHGLEAGKLDSKLTTMGTSQISSDAETSFIGWYVQQRPGKHDFYLFGQFRYAKEEYDNNRYVSAIGDSTIDASAGLYNSEFDIKSLNFTVGGAWNKHTGRTRITPMLALNYTELKRDGFAENGVQNQGLAINMGSDNYHRLVGTLGFSASRVYNWQDRRRAAMATADGRNNNYKKYSDAKLALSISAYYNHSFNNDRQNYCYNMIVNGLEDYWKPQNDSDSVDVKLGAAVITSENFSATVSAARHFGLKGYTDNRYSLSLDWGF